jgi:hypothetical protein
MEWSANLIPIAPWSYLYSSLNTSSDSPLPPDRQNHLLPRDKTSYIVGSRLNADPRLPRLRHAQATQNTPESFGQTFIRLGLFQVEMEAIMRRAVWRKANQGSRLQDPSRRLFLIPDQQCRIEVAEVCRGVVRFSWSVPHAVCSGRSTEPGFAHYWDLMETPEFGDVSGESDGSWMLLQMHLPTAVTVVDGCRS